jgi:hypothetical protein
MILVGIEDCPTCKIAKRLLLTAEYVELKRGKLGEATPPEIREIKRALGKLNPTGHFPVILNDDKTKMINTEILLDNLNVTKLEQLLVN